MTLDTAALLTSNVDPDISAAMVVYQRLNPLKDALGLADLSDAELQLFAMVAHHTGLDPFTRQIHAIKRKGKVTHQTGIDGYRATAEKTREYAGSDETEFEACSCGAEPKGHPSVARTIVHRILANGHVIDQVGVARWHELYPGTGDDGFMWRKMPHNQLSKCSEANGLRKAFPWVLGGVYIDEEMRQADVIEGEAKPVAPTARERIAERRAQAEAAAAAPAVIEGVVVAEEAAPAPEPAVCGTVGPYGDGATCVLPTGHTGNHKSADRATWNPR